MEANKPMSCCMLKDVVLIAREGLFQYGVRLGRRQDELVTAVWRNSQTGGWEPLRREVTLKAIIDGVRKGTITFINTFGNYPPITLGRSRNAN